MPRPDHEVMPILERVPSPIVFDHLAHIPQPDGVSDPLYGKILALIDKGRTWVKLTPRNRILAENAAVLYACPKGA